MKNVDGDVGRNVEQAIKVLRDGGIAIFPTDTTFGIGCRVDDGQAVARLFSIRKRAKDKAVPVLVENLEMAQKYWLAPLPDIVRRLAELYWPGGLTIIYRAKISATPPLVRGGGDTIGLRVPDHPTPINLIRKLGVGIVGTSANIAGGVTPYRLEDLDSELIKKVDYVLKGECTIKKPSTVVDCTKKPMQIIRKGIIQIS